jgi:hypothetical protein
LHEQKKALCAEARRRHKQKKTFHSLSPVRSHDSSKVQVIFSPGGRTLHLANYREINLNLKGMTMPSSEFEPIREADDIKELSDIEIDHVSGGSACWGNCIVATSPVLG